LQGYNNNIFLCKLIEITTNARIALRALFFYRSITICVERLRNLVPIPFSISNL